MTAERLNNEKNMKDNFEKTNQVLLESERDKDLATPRIHAFMPNRQI